MYTCNRDDSGAVRFSDAADEEVKHDNFKPYAVYHVGRSLNFNLFGH